MRNTNRPKNSVMLVLLVFICAVSQVTQALIAPQSKDALKENAVEIVVGKVVSVVQQVVTKPYGTDTVYTVTLAVDSVEKGTEPSKTVSFTFWKAKDRPQGWAGHYGQYEVIEPNMVIRAYLTKTSDGAFKLLEPNGWEKLH